MTSTTPLSDELMALAMKVKTLELAGQAPPVPPPLVPSPIGAKITTPGIQLVDAPKTVWELAKAADITLGLQLAYNGTVDTRTRNVTLAIIDAQGLIRQQNTAGGWWVCTSRDAAGLPVWSDSTDPRPAPIPVPPSGTANVVVNLAGATGKTLQPYVFGLATGALADNHMALAADATVKATLAKLRPPLMRFNANLRVAPTDMTKWASNAPVFMAPGARIVVGVPLDDPAGAATLARALRAAGTEVSWWEAGNEDDGLGAVNYADRFNAIADALHAVNPAYRVGGTIASWWGSIDIGVWADRVGARAGFFCFHSYPINDGDDNPTIYHKGDGFSDVASARQALQAHGLGAIPMFLGEYNMSGSQRPDGLWGAPIQASYVGALYVALVLRRCFLSDANFAMAALWDAVQDSYFGVVGNAANGGNNASITPQGHYLGQAAAIMPGAEIAVASTFGDVFALATKPNATTWALQLINTGAAKTIGIGLAGGQPVGSVRRVELGKSTSTPVIGTQASLASVSMPAETILMLAGSFA